MVRASDMFSEKYSATRCSEDRISATRAEILYIARKRLSIARSSEHLRVPRRGGPGICKRSSLTTG